MITRRYINMQSPIRALLYGIAIWFVWVSLVVFSADILPTGISGSPLFVSMQMAALAALVLGLRAMTSNAPGVSDALYLSMGVVNIAFPPAAIGTLVTGVFLSMDTKWGLLQHYWVATKLALSVGGDRHRHRLGGPPYPTVHLRAVGAGGGVQHDTRDRIGADDSSDPCRWPTRSCWGL
jgi:hypothetical protein